MARKIDFDNKTLIISIGFTRPMPYPSFSHNIGPKLFIIIVVLDQYYFFNK
jgi:hypothetical protein